MSETPDPDELAALAAAPQVPAPLPPDDEPEHRGATLFSAVGCKLAATMFLHHFTLGAWIVTLSSYVKANSGSSGAAIFSASFVGMVYGAGPVGGMISPFISGVLADRYFAAERIMAVLNIGGAAALCAAIAAKSQTAFYLALIAHFVCYLPSFALAASITFHHLEHPRRHFPLVRACGTMGWIAAGVFVGWFWPTVTGDFIEDTATPLKIAVVCELITAVFCFWLPHTPPSVRVAPAASGLASSESWRLLRSPQFAMLLVLAALAHVPSQFYYAYSNVYFNWLGVTSAAAKMTWGQGVEVACMILLPAVLLRVSVKWSIVAGLGVWGARFWMLAVSAGAANERFALAYAAILLHGIAFTLVSISLQMEVDQVAGRRNRATAQGLLSVAMQGIGCFLGAQLAGIAGASYLPAELNSATAAGWSSFWALPAYGALAVMAFASFVLPRDKPR